MTRALKCRLAVLLLAVLLTAPACGGDDDNPAAGSNTGGDPQATHSGDGDPPVGSGATGCEMLSVDEVADVVGNPIIGSTAFGTGCSYEVDNLADVNASFTTVDASTGDATLICESGLAAFTTYEEVSGLGDVGYVESTTAEREFEPGNRLAVASVLACTEDIVVSLALNGHRTEEELREMAVDLVGLILQRT